MAHFIGNRKQLIPSPKQSAQKKTT